MASLKSIQNICLYLFFFSINFEVYDPTGMGFLSVSKITAIIYFVTILPQFNKFFNLNSSYLKLICFFFLYFTFLNFLNINSVDSNYFDFPIFLNLILFWILLNHERLCPGILQKGFIAFAVGSVFLSIFYYLGIGVDYSLDNRITLFGDNENTVGIRMVVSVIIILILFIQKQFKNKKWAYLLLCFVPIMLLLMANTGSRVSLLSLSLSFILALLFIKTKGPIVKIIVLLIGIVIGVAVWNFIMETDVMKYRLQLAVQGDLAGRNYIWTHIIPLIEANPIFGVGKTGYDFFSVKTFGQISSPHNVFLEILSYTGIIGFSTYFFWFILLIKESIKYYLKTGMLLQLILFIPIIGLMFGGQILDTKLAWVIFAFAASRQFYTKKIYKMISKHSNATSLRYR